MKAILIINLLCICILLQTQSRIVHLLLQPQKTAYFECYKQQTGLDKIILHLVSIGDQFLAEYTQSINNAPLSTGLRVEAYHAPSTTSVEDLIQLYKNGNLNATDRLWLSLFMVYQDGASRWLHNSPEQNCRFLTELTEKIATELNIQVGIFAGSREWEITFQNILGCPQLSKYPLLWIPDQQENDGQANFNSYHQIGGWKTPTLKAYTLKTICGQGSIFENYYI